VKSKELDEKVGCSILERTIHHGAVSDKSFRTGTTTLKRRKRFKAIIIQPETTLGDTLQSTPEAIQSRRQAGKQRAEKMLGEYVGMRNDFK
jgi:hypothetical protein